MDDDAGPVYRASPANRAAAWVVFLVTAGLTVRAIVTADTLGGRLVGVVSAVLALLAAASLRFQVRAEREHLVVCWGMRLKRIPWSEIKGFGVDRGGKDVYVVMADKQRRRLPLSDVSTGRIAATDVRDSLQRYWKTHRR